MAAAPLRVIPIVFRNSQAAVSNARNISSAFAKSAITTPSGPAILPKLYGYFFNSVPIDFESSYVLL